MNRKHIGPIAAMVVSILVALAACQNPIALIDRRPVSGASSGTVTVKVQRVAPRISELFSAQITSLPALSSAARAYIATDKLHFTLMQDSSVVAEWDELLAAPQEVLTGMIESDGVPQSFNAPAHTVAAGSGYTLEAELYNSLYSADSPVVAGTSLPFAVTAENTAASPLEVSITCIPVSPTTLAKGEVSESFELAVPWVGRPESGVVVSVGSEQWYVVDLDEASDTHLFSVTPTAGSTAFLLITVYDGGGKFVGTGGLDHAPGEPAQVLLESPAGTYYIGVIDAQIEGDPATNGPFTVLVEDPEGGPDPLVGDWTLSWNEDAPDPAGWIQNITINDDFTWRTTYIVYGEADSADGTWVKESAGVYTLTTGGADAGAEPASLSVYLSADGQTFTSPTFGSNATFVHGVTLLPPTGLTATDLFENTPKVELEWAPSLSPEVTEYLILRRSSLEEQPVQIGSVDAAETSYVDEDVQSDATYYYAVTSSDGSRESPYPSNEVHLTLPATGDVVIEIE